MPPNILSLVNGSSSPTAFLIPPTTIRLGQDNFGLWRSTVLATLEAFNLESFVLTPNPPQATRIVTSEDGESTPEINPAYTEWKQSDRFVLLWLRTTLSDQALALVVRSSTSNAAWMILEHNFQSQTRARRMQLTLELISLPKGALSMAEYLQKKRSIADDLASNLHPVSDEDLIAYILQGLDPSYGPFKTSYMMKATDSVSVADVSGLLLQEETKLALEIAQQAPLLPTPPPPIHTAYQVDRNVGSSYQPHPSVRAQRPSSPSRMWTPPQRSRPQCQLCRRLGHEAADCRQRTNLSGYPSRWQPPQGRRLSSSPRPSQRHAYLAQHGDSDVVIDPTWYFDTGATDHVTPDLGKLTISEDYHGGDKLQIGNGKTSSSRGTQ
ncbi:Retrovirus-related Pol polyprotein from transposon RE1 [Linum perenne]